MQCLSGPFHLKKNLLLQADQLLPYSCDYKLQLLSIVVMSDSVMSWTAAHQAPLSIKFCRQEYQSRLPFSIPGDLPYPGIELMSPESLAGRFFTIEPAGKPRCPPCPCPLCRGTCYVVPHGKVHKAVCLLSLEALPTFVLFFPSLSK